MSVKVEVSRLLKYDNRTHHPGESLTVEPELAARWVERGHAVYVDGEPSSHSDQAIELVEALREAIPGLQPKPAAALVAAGHTDLESLASVDNQTLSNIDGVAAGTIATIREVVPYQDPDEDTDNDNVDTSDDSESETETDSGE